MENAKTSWWKASVCSWFSVCGCFWNLTHAKYSKWSWNCYSYISSLNTLIYRPDYRANLKLKSEQVFVLSKELQELQGVSKANLSLRRPHQKKEILELEAKTTQSSWIHFGKEIQNWASHFLIFSKTWTFIWLLCNMIFFYKCSY